MSSALVCLCSWFAPIRARSLEQEGASLVEYALLLALVVVVAVGALVLVGHTGAALINNSANDLSKGAP